MLVRNEPTPEQRLGERLRGLRMATGMSQAQVAHAMAEKGFSWGQTTTTKTESGDRPIRWNEIVALAEVLGVTPDAVVRSEDPEETTLVDHLRADTAVKEAHRRLRLAREETSDAEAAWEAALAEKVAIAQQLGLRGQP